jgi:diacylglycerol kinase family enzyme
VTRRRIAALLPKLLRGKHLDQPHIYHRRTERLTVEAAEPIPWHLDGEPQEPADYFEVEVVPGALRLA